ncbi:ATP-grasp domain-containing protein [Propionispora vibrioides]|uniref:ATP-grasp domain-containing protein n=1 Tax=Propionispora vibrioides TaxID=112903 RepID=A0A1H8XD63_9FIRM|nr:ATP-grasp domain-containing protein [Propionispora vibrioides]SEP37731.1 ATP-grasp domain-containing protein [Propionispora vibrioides]
MKEIVLYLGNARTGEYEWFYEHGIDIGIILDVNNSKNIADLSKFTLVETFNFTMGHIEDLFTIIENIKTRYNILCLLNMREFYVRQSAILSEKFNLRGLSIEAAENSLSKTKMRELFLKKLGKDTTAQYTEVGNVKELRDFINQVGLPVIIKPHNLYASLFVEKITDEDQIEKSYYAIKEGVLAYYKKKNIKSSNEKLLAEEFLEGYTHSIDCLIDEEGIVYTTPIVDGFTARDYGGNDFNRCAAIFPSQLKKAKQEQARELAKCAVKALGITSSLAHVELVFTSQGPKLLEVGARIGGSRAQMLNKAFGIDLVPAYAKMLQGKNFEEELKVKWEKGFAFARPLPSKRGVFRGLNNIDKILSLPSFYDQRLSIEAGTIVGPSKNGYMHFWTLECYSDDFNKVRTDIQSVLKEKNLFDIDFE